jgi:hypothetical protein
MTVQAAFQTAQSCREYCIDIEIRRGDGVVVFGATHTYTVASMAEREDQVHLQVHFPELPLLAGEYAVYFAIRESKSAGLPNEFQWGECSFKIASERGQSGIVNLVSHWSFGVGSHLPAISGSG